MLKKTRFNENQAMWNLDISGTMKSNVIWSDHRITEHLQSFVFWINRAERAYDSMEYHISSHLCSILLSSEDLLRRILCLYLLHALVVRVWTPFI